MKIGCGTNTTRLDTEDDCFLQEPGLIHDQHAGVVAQLLDHIGSQIIADRVGLPLSGIEQALHATRMWLAELFRQLPAVLALHRSQEALQVPPRPLPDLRAAEPRSEPRMQPVEPRGPRVDRRECCRP
jgi:hypothetical protein